MIHVAELTVVLGGAPRVRQVTLDARPGEVLALVGPNGAGKSCLLRGMVGDLPVEEGHVVLDDRPLDTWSGAERARRLVVLPQHPEAALGLCAQDVAGLGAELALGVADAATAVRALDAVGMASRRRAPVDVLSGGERQRVHLARVLTHAWLAPGPCAVLLDEPLSAQDPGRIGDVLRHLRRLADDDHAVVVVLHDLVAAAAVADRVALLSAGALAACGRPDEVLEASLLTVAFGAPMSVSVGPHRRPVPLPILDLEMP